MIMPRQSVWQTSRTWLVKKLIMKASDNESLWLDVTHPGVAGVEEHGDGRDVEDREHHRRNLHTEQRRGDHKLRRARHEPDGKTVRKKSGWLI